MMESGTPFSGVRFSLVGFNPTDENTLRTKLLSGGGVDVGHDTQTCTHLIVDSLVYDDPICVAARRNGKVVVTGSWVDHSFDSGMLSDSHSVLYRPVKDLKGIPGAESIVVCLTGYQAQEREDIMTLVDMMGGEFSKPLVSNQVTHLICYKFEGEKYEFAKAMKRIKIVNHRWVEDCLKQWKLLPEIEYAISGYDLEMMGASVRDSEDEEEDASVRRANNSPLGLRVTAVEMSKSTVIQTTSAAGEGSSLCNASRENLDRNLEAMVSSDVVSVQQYNNHRASIIHEPEPGSLKENLRPVSTTNDPAESGEVCHNSHTTVKQLGSNVVPVEVAISTTGNSILKCARDGVSERSSTEPMVGNLVRLQEPISGSPKQNLKVAPNRNDRADGSETVHKVDLSDSAARLFNLGDVPMEADVWTKKKVSFNGALEFVPERSVIEPATRRFSSPRSGMKDQQETELPQKKTVARKNLGSRGKEKSLINQKGSLYLSERTPKKERAVCLNKEKASAPVTDNGNQKEISRSVLHTEAVPEMAKHIDPKTDALDSGFSCFGRKSTESHTPEMAKHIDSSDAAVQLEVDKTIGKRRKEDTVEKDILQSGKKGSSSAVELEKRSVKKAKSSNVEYDAKAADTVGKHIANNSAEKMENIAVDNEFGDGSSEGTQSLDAGKSLARQEATVEISCVQSGEKQSYSTVEVGKASVKKTKKSRKQRGAKATRTVMKHIGDHSAGHMENITVDDDSGDVSSDGTQSLVTGEPLAREEAATETEVGTNKRKHGKEATVERSSVQNGKKESSSTVEVGNSSVKKTKKSKKEKKNIVGDNNCGKIGSSGDQSLVSGKQIASKKAATVAKTCSESTQLTSKPMVSRKVVQEPRFFTVSGPRDQRKQYQQMIKSLEGKCCRDSHIWSYQATHFIAPELRRTEKFFAAAASGSWILKTDYVADSKEAGILLPEEPYEWHSSGLSTDGVINFKAPRKWRLVRELTGHGAFYGMRIVVYGDCNFPSLDTLKRAVKAGDGTILATAPPYTRFLNRKTDFAVIGFQIPSTDSWIQEFMRHEIPCVLSDYLVEYVCKSGYPLDKHVLYNTHSWAEQSFNKLQVSAEEKVVTEEEEEDAVEIDDIACEVCGSLEREEVMLICGDEQGFSGCGIGTHIDCCDPPLTHVPEHDWFCSRCNVKSS